MKGKRSIETTTIEIPFELMERMLRQIEHYECALDGEYGKGRNADQLILDREMPDIYYEILEVFENSKDENATGRRTK